MTLVLLLSAACTAADPSPPWEHNDMVREVSADLLRFEGIGLDVSTVEVLAWRTIERSQVLASPPRLPAVVIRRRSDAALLWARGELRTGAAGWLLAEVFRPDGEQWSRALMFREYQKPPPSLRPGETADGTWHGVAEYTHPPTSREICEFASVSFLATGPELRSGAYNVKTTGALRRRAWRRIARDEPACDGWPR
jgi:hypothetical protein